MSKSQKRRQRARKFERSQTLRNLPGRSLRYELLEDRRMLAVVTVTTDQDVVDFNDGVTSLREAIFATNLVEGPDEIQFDFGYDGPATILLTMGELAITDSVKIVGLGAELLTIDASGNDPTSEQNIGDGTRILNIDDGDSRATIDVELRGLTLTGGDVAGSGGAILSARENLMLTDMLLNGNAASTNGGGLFASLGTTMITSSTFSNNAAGRDGGGIWTSGTTEITNSTISDNSAKIYGGGIMANHITTITNSTISGNSAVHGGGIRTIYDTTVVGSTLSNNSADGVGGGIWAERTATITKSMIYGNTAGNQGGGIWVSDRFSTTMMITSSTISENSAGAGGGIASIGITTIINSTISGNSAISAAGGIVAGFMTTIIGSTISGNSAGSWAGGIMALRTTTIIDSTILDNSAGNSGGGIWTRGRFATTTINNSIISQNSAGLNGGGIWASASRRTIITNSAIDENSAEVDGGGIWADESIEITDSTVSGNMSGDDGGGIWTEGRFTTMTINNSTISGNSAGDNGGAIYFNDSTSSTIVRSTITDNTSDADLSGTGSGGGLFLRGGSLTIDHSIVAQNTDLSSIGPDLTGFLGVIPDVNFSLIGNNTGSSLAEARIGLSDANGNLIGDPTGNGIINPLFGPLADNGGPTLTHALLPDSPAINAGDLNAIAGVDDVPQFDQRGEGFGRIFSRIDIGAFEVQELSDLNLLVDTLEDESDGDFSRGDLSLREAIKLANANPGPDTIRFDPIRSAIAIAGPLPATILLTQGELAITDSVNIIGLGAELLTIDASGNDPTPDENNGDGSRVFNIDDKDDGHLIDVAITGLTLTGGDVSGKGGAILSAESLQIAESEIVGNYASAGGGGVSARLFMDATVRLYDTELTNNRSSQLSRGGGISVYSYDSGTVLLDRVTISGNSGRGGGVHASLRDSSKMAISLSTIRQNTSLLGGGGLSIGVLDSSRLNIASSVISGNIARTGGGIVVGGAQNGAINIKSTRIEGNSVGGTYSYAAGIQAKLRGQATLLLDSSMIINNVVTNGKIGRAGFYVLTENSSRAVIQNSTITGNKSIFSDAGGLSALAIHTSSIVISSSTISGNRAKGDGGGVYAFIRDSGVIRIEHSTITDNISGSNTDGSGRGGGIYVASGSIDLDHTIVAGNFANSGVAPDVAGIIHSSFSLIGFGAEFLGPLRDNGGPTLTHALLPGSPAINAGDPQANDIPPFDQRGNPFTRLFGDRIDIGAYETQPLPGDFDRDGDSDGDDLAQWLGDFGLNGGSDSDRDGDTDGADFLNWQRTLGVGLSEVVSPLVAVNALAVVEPDIDFAWAVDQLFSVQPNDRPPEVVPEMAIVLAQPPVLELSRPVRRAMVRTAYRLVEVTAFEDDLPAKWDDGLATLDLATRDELFARL